MITASGPLSVRRPRSTNTRLTPAWRVTRSYRQAFVLLVVALQVICSCHARANDLQSGDIQTSADRRIDCPAWLGRYNQSSKQAAEDFKKLAGPRPLFGPDLLDIARKQLEYFAQLDSYSPHDLQQAKQFQAIDRSTIDKCLPDFAASLKRYEEAVKPDSERAVDPLTGNGVCPTWTASPGITYAAGMAADALNAEPPVSDPSLTDQTLLAHAIDQLSTSIRQDGYPGQPNDRYAIAAGKADATDMKACFKELNDALSKRQHALQDVKEIALAQQPEQPKDALASAYRDYIAVKSCYESRDGYAAVYINEQELENAREEIKAIEAEMLRRDTTLKTDELWAEASSPEEVKTFDDVATIFRLLGESAVKKHVFNEDGQRYCRTALEDLDSIRDNTTPNEPVIKKDF